MEIPVPEVSIFCLFAIFFTTAKLMSADVGQVFAFVVVVYGLIIVLFILWRNARKNATDYDNKLAVGDIHCICCLRRKKKSQMKHRMKSM